MYAAALWLAIDTYFVMVAGTWANKVSHPSSGVTKEYIVTTNERPTKRQLQNLCQGCVIDGTQVQPVDVLVENSDPSQRNKIRIVLAEGKNREVPAASCPWLLQ